jgi:Protein phosphatase 2C
MNADSAFVIGATHSICQDYVVAGNPSTTNPYVILSDGCSSSPDTDIGARLLVKSAESILKTVSADDIADLHAAAAAATLDLAASVGLKPQAVDATLLTGHVQENELVLACSGDGVLMVQDCSGVIEAYSISYPSGHPFYPAYTHQPDRLAALEFGGNPQKEIKYFRGDSKQSTLRLEATCSSVERTEVRRFDARSYLYAVLLSDGVHSFYSSRGSESSKSARPIRFQALARELVSFKNVRGAFAGRRLKRFLKDSALNGWHHTDDLALGAFYLGD